MRRQLLAGMAAVAILGGNAIAQVVIEFSPEQRTTIREYVVREKVKPVTVRERIAVGAVLPEDVEFHPVPGAWGPAYSRYRYIYHDDRVVFVEPGSRRVVHILD